MIVFMFALFGFVKIAWKFPQSYLQKINSYLWPARSKAVLQTTSGGNARLRRGQPECIICMKKYRWSRNVALLPIPMTCMHFLAPPLLSVYLNRSCHLEFIRPLCSKNLFLYFLGIFSIDIRSRKHKLTLAKKELLSGRSTAHWLLKNLKNICINLNVQSH